MPLDMFVGTSCGGVFHSTNKGATWTVVNSGLTSQCVYALADSGNLVFAGTSGGGVYSTSNFGTNWVQMNTGLGNLNINYLYVYNNYLYAGTGSCVWRCVATLTGNIDPTNDVPKVFRLEQNYPNPFNPNTSIKYQISTKEFVTIKVYDILGKLVTTLVNEKKEPGTYDVQFDGTNYASGLYFYKIEAGDFEKTLKMVLVK
jgi:hypothetical protein